MNKGQHWTERTADDFVHRISFDFVTQIEKALEVDESSQAELAKNLGVTEGRVSQILNNPGNIGLKNIVKYARAIGRKVAIVLYDDGDAMNNNGPVNSEIFSTCWQRAGCPADFFELKSVSTVGSIQASGIVVLSSDFAYLTSGYNSTFPYYRQWLGTWPGTPAFPGPVNIGPIDFSASAMSTSEQSQGRLQ
jgi:transcriptional regulator with XRE-family HTH domain